ncbi:MAG TPA: hypothetical protein GXZ61_04205 [Clostridiales bacterium]|jgi:cell division protein FtsL|nr:hypothetical protein [Clostridiales bacterium]
MAAEDRKFNSNANRYYTVGSAAYKTDVAPQYEPRVLPKKPAATPQPARKPRVVGVPKPNYARRALAIFTLLFVACGIVAVIISYTQIHAGYAELTKVNSAISQQEQEIQQLNHEISSKTDINRLTQQAIENGFLSPTMQEDINP